MELPSELAVAAHLDVDALIERQSQKIEGLVHVAAALGSHIVHPFGPRTSWIASAMATQ